MWRRLQQRCSFSLPGGDTVPSPDCVKLALTFCSMGPNGADLRPVARRPLRRWSNVRGQSQELMCVQDAALVRRDGGRSEHLRPEGPRKQPLDSEGDWLQG